MEISTCEEYVIAELEEAKDHIEELEGQLQAAFTTIYKMGQLLYGYDKEWTKWLKGEDEEVPS